MAISISPVSLFLLIVIMLWNGAKAQSGCTMAIVSLSPCLNYVTGNSSTPSSSCCSRLSSVVQSQPQCLCTLLKGGASSFGVTINQTLALDLPGACNVQTPPVSQCNAVNGPASSAATPASSPSDSPATAASSPSDSPATGASSPSDSPATAASSPSNSPATAASSPSDSPADETPEVPDTPSELEPDTPSDTGSKTVPRTDGGSVGGTTTGATFSFISILLLIASSWAFSGTGF